MAVDSRTSTSVFWRLFVGVAVGLLVVLASGGIGSIGQYPRLFMLRFSLVWGSCFALVILFPRKGFPRVFPPTAVILLLAFLARLATFPMESSDDVNRYLWEGRLVAEGISPYRHAPDDPALAALAATDPFHPNINHSDLPAAYPPFAIGIFSLVGRVSYNLWAMKALMVAFDLACVYILLRLLRFRRLDARWALLYALNPVILYAFAGEGHFDAFQNFFLLVALLAFDRRRWGWMFLAAGLAIQSKYVSIVAVPFLLRRDNLKYAWVGAVAVLVPFLPFIAKDGGNIFYCITEFGEKFDYNGSIHALFRLSFGGLDPATNLSKLALAIGLPIAFFLYSPLVRRRYQNDPVTGMLVAWSILLVFAPTVHFWYLSWIIPLLVLRPLRSWLLLCLTISVVFITTGIYYYTNEWRLPPVAQIIEWLPVLLLLLCEMISGLRRLRDKEEPVPKTISVIIPTSNEGEWIERCIQPIAACAEVIEVLVVDGASQDDTVTLARAAGATVMEGLSGGRGGQVLAGIEQARGDVIAIVHADSLVPPELLTNMLKVLQRNPGVAGGAIGAGFTECGWRLRLIEFMNDARAAFLGIGFGDQVQFFRRKSGMQKQVFCGLPLMEDVELSLRLGRIGRSVFLFGDVQTSARKWEKSGYGRAGLIIQLVGTYLWRRLWGRVDTAAMYRQYYRSEGE